MKPTRTIKIREATYRALKVRAAQLGISMLDLLDALVESSKDTQGTQRPAAQDERLASDTENTAP